jgi:hypothetical protein
VAGDLAFVTDGSSGLQIINITNPSAPTLTGTYDTTQTANDVTVAGDLAFVADGFSGLQIINITNRRFQPSPAATTRRGRPTTSRWRVISRSWRTVLRSPDHQHHQSGRSSLTGTYHTPGMR